MGGNFLSATPDTLFTAAALRKTLLTVHVSTKLNRSHLVHGKMALILPCLGRTDKDFQDGREQFVSCENSMGVVQLSKGVLQPPSNNLLSEVAIVCRLAKHTLRSNHPDWMQLEKNYDLIRDYIEQVIPGLKTIISVSGNLQDSICRMPLRKKCLIPPASRHNSVYFRCHQFSCMVMRT